VIKFNKFIITNADAHAHELPYVSDDIDLPSRLDFDQPFSSFPGDLMILSLIYEYIKI
jgi:hypothetical protein